MKSICFLFGMVMIAIGLAGQMAQAAPRSICQEEEIQKAEVAKPDQDPVDPKPEEKKPEEPAIEVTSVDQVEIGPREIRLTLWDGTVVKGNLGYSAIHINTQFGRLEVPVANVLTIRPGLQSVPELKTKLDQLIEQLGDKEFQVREKAKLKLIAMGAQIYDQVKAAQDGGSAERKKHLQTILESLLEQRENEVSSGNPSKDTLIAEDSITTPTFTIVGQIEEKEYELATSYGLLKINLENIKLGDRTWNGSVENIQKRMDIAADAFFQRTPASTKIRVNAGDKISITADGNVNWASWGNINSGPDGVAEQGNWRGFNCGMVVARIGNGNEYIGIGRKKEFVAKTSGELTLGVAMQDNYAQQNGYQWNGNYTVTINVESQRR